MSGVVANTQYEINRKNPDPMDAFADSAQQLVQYAQTRFDSYLRYWDESKEISRENLQLVIGEQWNDEEKLELLNRPDGIYNIILPKIMTIAGSEQIDSFDVQTAPGDGNKDPNATMVADYMFKHIKAKNHLDHLNRHLFIDGLIHEEGSFYSLWQVFNEKHQKELMLEKEDPIEVWTDPNSKAYDMSDAKDIFKRKWMSMEEIYNRWPDKAQHFTGIYGGTASGNNYHDDTDSHLVNRNFDYYNRVNDTYAVIERQYVRRIKKKSAVDLQSNKMYDLSQLTDFEAASEIRKNKTWRPKNDINTELWHLVFAPSIANYDFLTHVKSPFQIRGINGRPKFLIRRFTPFLFSGKSTTITSKLRDPQKFFNKLKSLYLESIAANTHGGVGVEKGSLVDEEHWKANWTKPGFIGEVERGRRVPEPLRTNNNAQETAFAITAEKYTMDEVGFVTPSLEGRSEKSGESGIKYEAKRQQSSITLTPIMGNWKQTKLDQGEMIFAMSRKIYDEPRWLRITGADVEMPNGLNIPQTGPGGGPVGAGAAGININKSVIIDGIYQIINNIAELNVDVFLIEGFNSPTVRKEQLMMLGQMVQRMAPEAVRWDIVIDLFDFGRAKEWAGWIKQNLYGLGPGGQPLGQMPGGGGSPGASGKPTPMNSSALTQLMAGAGPAQGRTINQ